MCVARLSMLASGCTRFPACTIMPPPNNVLIFEGTNPYPGLGKEVG